MSLMLSPRPPWARSVCLTASWFPGGPAPSLVLRFGALARVERCPSANCGFTTPLCSLVWLHAPPFRRLCGVFALCCLCLRLPFASISLSECYLRSPGSLDYALSSIPLLSLPCCALLWGKCQRRFRLVPTFPASLSSRRLLLVRSLCVVSFRLFLALVLFVQVWRPLFAVGISRPLFFIC